MKTPIHSCYARWCKQLLLPTLIAGFWLPGQSFAATNIYWDPVSGNNQVDGGSGSWNAESSNSVWTTSTAATSNTSWTTGTGIQAVFGGASADANTYVINVASTSVQAQAIRFISNGYLLTALTPTSISLLTNTTDLPTISVGTGITVNIGSNLTVVSGNASSRQLTFSGSGTIIVSATSASALTTIKASGNNNVAITGGVNLTIGQNAVLQTALSTNGGSGNGNMVIGTDTTDATLTVNGGLVNFGSLVMGNAAATGVSTLTINSGTVATVASNGVLRFANTSNTTTSGTAIVNLNGGVLDVAAIYIGKSGNAQYQLNFNGGTVQVAGTSALSSSFLAASSQITASVLAGGAIFDTNGNNATIAQGLVSGVANDGGLTKKGTGTLTLTGTNTYNGATTVQSGSLVVAATSNISSNLVLGGSGGLTGTLDVSAKGAVSETNISGAGTIIATTMTATGVVKPGVDIGTLNVSGNFTLAGTASTEMQIGGISSFDLIHVSGILTYNGSLVISSYEGFDLTQAGSYDLFDFGSKSGDFSSVTVNGVTLTLTGGQWSDGSGQYSFDESTGILSVAAVPEPGTYAILLSGLGMLGLLRRKLRA